MSFYFIEDTIEEIDFFEILPESDTGKYSEDQIKEIKHDLELKILDHVCAFANICILQIDEETEDISFSFEDTPIQMIGKDLFWAYEYWGGEIGEHGVVLNVAHKIEKFVVNPNPGHADFYIFVGKVYHRIDEIELIGFNNEVNDILNDIHVNVKPILNLEDTEIHTNNFENVTKIDLQFDIDEILNDVLNKNDPSLKLAQKIKPEVFNFINKYCRNIKERHVDKIENIRNGLLKDFIKKFKISSFMRLLQNLPEGILLETKCVEFVIERNKVILRWFHVKFDDSDILSIESVKKLFCKSLSIDYNQAQIVYNNKEISVEVVFNFTTNKIEYVLGYEAAT